MTGAEGGCLCGAIRYRFSDQPSSSIVCHCISCRKASGAGAVAWVTVARSGFEFVAGEPARHHSSPGVVRRFCSRCGSALTYENDGHPGMVDVTTATLDEPSRHPPTAELWLDHRIGWQATDPGLTHWPAGMQTGS